MLTTIKGYYDNGHVTLLEQPPLVNKGEVIVTFLTEEKKGNPKKRILGALQGSMKMTDNFDAPLEDLKEYM